MAGAKEWETPLNHWQQVAQNSRLASHLSFSTLKIETHSGDVV